MKNKYLNLVLFLVLGSTSFAANGYKEFYATVSQSCGEVNNLLVKKSYLSLIRKRSCDSIFIKNFLKVCSQMDCEKILAAYSLSVDEELGNVIGR